MGISSCIATLSVLVVGALAHPASTIVLDTAPNFSLRGENTSLSNLVRRQNVNYNQDYVAAGASVSYSPNQAAGTFGINFNTHADFVVGLGWQPGNSK
jgi:hypothetical protein